MYTSVINQMQRNPKGKNAVTFYFIACHIPRCVTLFIYKQTNERLANLRSNSTSRCPTLTTRRATQYTRWEGTAKWSGDYYLRSYLSKPMMSLSCGCCYIVHAYYCLTYYVAINIYNFRFFFMLFTAYSVYYCMIYYRLIK